MKSLPRGFCLGSYCLNLPRQLRAGVIPPKAPAPFLVIRIIVLKGISEMDPYTTPDARKTMYTPSGRFDCREEAPQTRFDRLDVLTYIAAALIALTVALVAWKALPKITAGIHAAEEISQLREQGY